MKHVLCSNVSWMEIVQPLNRSWIYDTYFSSYKAIHLGKKSGGEMSGYPAKHTQTMKQKTCLWTSARSLTHGSAFERTPLSFAYIHYGQDFIMFRVVLAVVQSAA